MATTAEDRPSLTPPDAMPGPQIVTLGCRLNIHESDVMRAHAAAAGLDDIVIINTCAVTAEAVRQATQTIRRLRRERPATRIVVTGCAAQIAPERFADLDEVDHVIGNAEKMKLETFTSLSTARVQVSDIMDARTFADRPVDPLASRARATIAVQNGCDHRCTFCIIPFGRGPSRSLPQSDVIAQAEELVSRGHNEIVLTGVDMTSWGGDLPGRPALGTLVRAVLRNVPNLARLRLSSIDQIEVDDELLLALAQEDRLMPHLHLSLQAGDDLTLKRMKRRHTRADAIKFCQHARRLRPDVVFGADFIAGFPTETEDMFARTLDLIDACGLTYLHVFPFSPRPGTPAARMPQTAKVEIKQRAARLRASGDAALAAYLATQPGQTTRVLIEGHGVGRTPQFAQVQLDTSTIPRGALANVRITGASARHLIGEARP